jgi:hypothetical protein
MRLQMRSNRWVEEGRKEEGRVVINMKGGVGKNNAWSEI